MSTRLTLKPPSDFVEFPKSEINQCIHQRIEKQAGLYPGQIALKTPEVAYSYAELNGEANAIAEKILATSGTHLGQAAILLPNTPEMIVSILAVLKAHKCYVPLDPKLPECRLRVILDDVDPVVLLTDDSHMSLAATLAKGRVPIINISRNGFKSDAPNPNVQCDPLDRAYILYTSGTTGIPKGITFVHRNLLHHIACMTNNLFFAPSDRVTWLHSASFSASVVDIYSCLMNGGSLYPWDFKTRGFIGMADWFVRNHVTTLQWIPSAFRQFLRTVPADFILNDVRIVVMASEPLTVREVDLFRRHFPVGSHLINQVGTSESYNYRLYTVDHSIPIEHANIQAGYSVSEDREVLILDDNHRTLPVGSAGEIAVKSPYMSAGYWRNEELTRAKFIQIDKDQTRAYLTGDVGMLEAGGCLIHLGRKDSQVKIRGYRVELAEVDHALSAFSDVTDSITRTAKAQSGENHLVSYILLAENASFDQRRIEMFLNSRLPEYMVPAQYVVLDGFPQLPNGKVDYQQLPNPFETTGKQSRSQQHIGSAMDEIVSMFSEVLELSQISEEDDFVGLGGDSLSLAVLAHLVKQRYGTEIDTDEFLKNPTPRSLANLIENHEALQSRNAIERSNINAIRSAPLLGPNVTPSCDRFRTPALTAPRVSRACRNPHAEMKNLIIIGAGGLGRETYTWAIQAAASGAPWRIKGFLDKRANALDHWKIEQPILGDIADYRIEPDDVFIGAIGKPHMKVKCYAPMIEQGAEFVNVIHPLASIGTNVKLGVGIVAGPFASITCDVVVGDHVSIGALSNLGHDSFVGTWSHISSHCGINGMAALGEGVFLGSHSCIIPGVSVGNWAYVGAGSIVLKDVAELTKVFGNPAAVIGRSHGPSLNATCTKPVQSHSGFAKP